jgi:hypothetical protein
LIFNHDFFSAPCPTKVNVFPVPLGNSIGFLILNEADW